MNTETGSACCNCSSYPLRLFTDIFSISCLAAWASFVQLIVPQEEDVHEADEARQGLEAHHVQICCQGFEDLHLLQPTSEIQQVQQLR